MPAPLSRDPLARRAEQIAAAIDAMNAVDGIPDVPADRAAILARLRRLDGQPGKVAS